MEQGGKHLNKRELRKIKIVYMRCCREAKGTSARDAGII
jgi:hypothetical protein